MEYDLKDLQEPLTFKSDTAIKSENANSLVEKEKLLLKDERLKTVENVMKGRVEETGVLQDGIKDKFFGGLFVAHIGFIVFVAVVFGVPNISKFNFTTHEGHPNGSQGFTVFVIFLSTALVGGVGSMCWLYILQRYTAMLIRRTLQLGILIFTVGSVASFCGIVSGSGPIGIALGMVFGFFAITSGVYYKYVQNRIPFAAVHLTTSTVILAKFPRMIYAAYGGLVAQFGWILVWSAAMVGIWAETAGNLKGSGFFANITVLMMLTSFYWGLQVIKNIVHCTAAGVVGEWWYHIAPEKPVQNAAYRSITTAFGSICLGSLVIAVLSSLRTVLHYFKRKPSRRLNACLESLMYQLERSAQYFNMYAYCQVALYGKDLQSAGFDTISLFRQRGWTAIVNDQLISGVLRVGCLIVGGITAVIGAGWSYHVIDCSAVEKMQHADQCDSLSVLFITYSVCLLMGYGMCSIVSTIIESIVATVFVCYAQDPAALQTTNPHEFNRITNAWRRFHPSTMDKSGPAYSILCV